VATHLLARGADPNAAKQGWTALHQVARTRSYNLGNVPHPQASGSMSSLDFARELLKRGADINAKMTKEIRNDGYRFTMSRIGATPYLVAAKGADAPLMRILAEKGADTLAANEAGTTPLMAASGVDLAFLGEDTGTHADAFEAVQVALEFKHDLHAQNKTGDTALHGAARRGALPIVELFIAKGAKLDTLNRRGWTPLTVALGYKGGKPLFLNEQRQLDAAVVLFKAMQTRNLPISEDAEALALMRASTEHSVAAR
jgi:ankyrin repeat protein